MTNDREKIVRWIQETVERDYREDIALVLIYGSHINGTTNRLSDVDTFFIPKTDRGFSFARTFILKGIGYDIFPMSWERVSRIAEIHEHLLPLLGDSVILFSSTKEDTERFLSLRTRMRALLDNQVYMDRQALRMLEKAVKNLLIAKAKHNLHEVRLEAGRCFLALADGVAYANGTHFHQGLKKHLHDLNSFPKIPDNFLEYYDECIRADNVDDIIKTLSSATDVMAKFLEVPYPNEISLSSEVMRTPRKIDLVELASFYEELVSAINKIRINIEEGDWRMTFVNGVCLSNALEDITTEFGLKSMPVLEEFEADNLPRFLFAVEEMESQLIQMIESGGGVIHRYADFDTFIKENG